MDSLRLGDNLPARISSWAKSQPNSVAVSDGDVCLSYSELFALAGKYKSALTDANVGLGDKVVLCLPKSSEAVAALLGILASGAAYVPIDPKTPVERQMLIWEDANPAASIVASNEFSFSSAPAFTPASISALHSDFTTADITQEHDAYVMYTSGSTGKPNGVRISHRAMTHFFSAVNTIMHVNCESVCINTSALVFDVSIVDLLLPLNCGARVFLGPSVFYPPLILDLIEREHATHMCGVGTTMNLLADSVDFSKKDLLSLQYLMTGAEVLSIATIERWLKKCPSLTVINGYGPTETTCVATAFLIDHSQIGLHKSYPIGFPLPGLLIHIDGTLDESNMMVGELWISGPQVLSGYLNKSDLDTKKIVNMNGLRYYRTGDMVRLDDRGILFFLGRIDDEIKVRGYRVHLDDVAHPYRSDPNIAAAVTVPVKHVVHGECLAIALSPIHKSVDLDVVHREASKQLPVYMRPYCFILMDEVPKTISGKIDVVAVRNQAIGKLKQVEMQENTRDDAVALR